MDLTDIESRRIFIAERIREINEELTELNHALFESYINELTVSSTYDEIVRVIRIMLDIYGYQLEPIDLWDHRTHYELLCVPIRDPLDINLILLRMISLGTSWIVSYDCYYEEERFIPRFFIELDEG